MAWSAAVAIALYLPTVGFGFVWDDHRLVERNPMLRSVADLGRLLVSDFWTSAAHGSGFWRPLVTLSAWLDGHLGGFRPAGFHATNVLAHAVASALVAALALESGLPWLVALAGGVWFAVMPAHVESVAWISGRTDLLSALFFLLALWLDRRARRAGRRGPGFAPLLALALALGSKEAAALFVVVIALAEWIEVSVPRASLRARARWIAPYLALTLVWLVAHQALVRFAGLPAQLSGDLAARGRWAALAMLPASVTFLAPWVTHNPGVTLALPAGPFAPAVVAGAVLEAGLLVSTAMLAARRSPLAVPVGLFWIALLPPMLVAATQAYLLFGERLIYLASAGAALAAAHALAALGRRRRLAAAAAIVACAWIGWSAVAAVRATAVWRDDATLFRSMTEAAPRNTMARVGWAQELMRAGRVAEAEEQLRAAEALDPSRPETPLGHAWIAARRGDWPAVLERSGRALALDSLLLDARVLRLTALLRLGRMREGAPAMERLERDAPGTPAVQSLWGQYQLALGAPAVALPALASASRVLADDADLWFALGMAHARLDHTPEARAAFAAATRADPGFYDAWLKLATACHLSGDPPGRDAALARAAALPEARDGRAELLRVRLLRDRR